MKKSTTFLYVRIANVLKSYGVYIIRTDRNKKVKLYCSLFGLKAPIKTKNSEFLQSEYLREGSPIHKTVKLQVTPRIKRTSKKSYNQYISKSENWKSFRQSIIDTRGRKCEKCGETKGAIDCHHLTYERLFNEIPSDVMLLCRSCHKKEHGRK